MKHRIYEETFTRHRLRYAFQYPGSELYMMPYIRKTEGDHYDILAPLEYIDQHRPYYTESMDDRYVEYKSLIGLTAEALLPLGCYIMHAVAVLMGGVSWLITAPSGTGKSTQYFNLKELYGEKVQMICGDMPLMSRNRKGDILISPTPWNGKERIKGRVAAPLGGILYLCQGPENTIHRLKPEEAVLPVMTQLVSMPETEEQVTQIAKFSEEIIQAYPVWEMVNLGDTASTELAVGTFREYMNNRGHRK